MDDPDEPLPTTAEQLIREQIGGGAPIVRYRLGPTIAKGGMGEIVTAHDEEIGREVAIKRMRALSPNARQIARFLREACIQGRLEHPAIVPVHELGTDAEGQPFFAMKKLTGTTLTQILKKPHSRQRVLRAFADVCLAVEFAHAHGVIHRDIKPDNLMLGDFGETYVLDWGVAKAIGEADDAFPATGDELTRAGIAIGTAGFMSPEQERAEEIDGRADVYGLGCVLFEILAGEAMHPRTAGGVISRDAIEKRPTQRAPTRDNPPELDDAVEAATASNQTARLATARELAERIERYLDGDRDLALRKDLAAKALTSARGAFAERADGVAMREAGRALALDPTSGAAELVGRLMLEPPPVRPPEVTEAIRKEQLDTLAHNARTGAWGYLAYLAFVPPMLWTGETTLALALLVAVAANLGMVIWNGYIQPHPRPVRLAIGNAVLIALVARLFSPFLVAPGVAAVTAMMLSFSPTYRRTGPILVLGATMSLSVVAPWFLELAGAISRTTTLTASGIAIDAPGLHFGEVPKIVFLTLYGIAAVAASVGMSHAMRRAELQEPRSASTCRRTSYGNSCRTSTTSSCRGPCAGTPSGHRGRCRTSASRPSSS